MKQAAQQAVELALPWVEHVVDAIAIGGFVGMLLLFAALKCGA